MKPCCKRAYKKGREDMKSEMMKVLREKETEDFAWKQHNERSGE